MSRRRPGEIRDSIVRYLNECGTPAPVSEIREGVNRDLGGDVSPSSIRSYLRLEEGRLFQRTERGVYALPDFEEPAVSGPNSTFQFGEATLYQHDCLEWLRAREPVSIHAVVTDPPYGLVEYSALHQTKLRNGHGGVWRVPPSFDGHVRAPLPRFTTLTAGDLRALETFFYHWAKLVHRVIVPGGHVLVASNPLVSYLVANAVVRAGFERRGEIVRLVMTMRGGDRPKNAHEEFPGVTVMPRSMWEPWLVFRRPTSGRVQDNLRVWKTGALRRPSSARPFGDVIQSHPTHASERRHAPHPSLKPQDFLRQVVRAVLPLGEGIVLDPFAGSGSTLAAAEAVGYRSIGVEKDPHYFEMARTAIPALAQLSVTYESSE